MYVHMYVNASDTYVYIYPYCTERLGGAEGLRNNGGNGMRDKYRLYFLFLVKLHMIHTYI